MTAGLLKRLRSHRAGWKYAYYLSGGPGLADLGSRREFTPCFKTFEMRNPEPGFGEVLILVKSSAFQSLRSTIMCR